MVQSYNAFLMHSLAIAAGQDYLHSRASLECRGIQANNEAYNQETRMLFMQIE